ncbi:FeoA domain-containing protein [Clostridioides difficile]|nr:FeoA domain-containing protein [Clostridioides difficile]
MNRLKDIKCGETVKVKKLEGEGATRRRITRGVNIFIRKVAPLGDPIEVTVRDYELSIRKSDAEKIIVE